MVQQEGTKKKKKSSGAVAAMGVMRPHAAGIDIGSRSHWVAVPADRDEMPVREFGGFTDQLYRLADWLKSCGIETVAMESTGVYWIALYDVLESRGFEVLLVNASHLRNVPGRKSDVKDCQWLQQLHSYGLLRGSFRPPQEVLELRAYMRQRERLIQGAVQPVQHMQKALLEMNLQVHHVLSDLTGSTGMAIVRAIVAGERDGHKLAEHRDRRCRQSKEQIAKALQGTYKKEHVFALTQALRLYDVYQEQLQACDNEIERKLSEMAERRPTPSEPCPKPRHGAPKNNQPRFEIQSPLHRICGGVDLTQVHGLAPATALNVLSEVGQDMSRWSTEKHFTSWLNLAPGTRITGGKSQSGRRGPSKNRAGLALRQAAVSVGRTDTALGAFYRRHASRTSPASAAVATARKIAVLIYRALKYGLAFVEAGAAAYEQQQRERQLRALTKRAASFGLKLLPETTDLAAAPN